jgi:hypothetical protein
MRVAALVLSLAGGLIALLASMLVLVVVADKSVQPQLGISALIAVAIIVLAVVAFISGQTRVTGVALVLLSGIALALGFFSEVFVLAPLLVGYGLSLAGGILALLR